MTLVNQQRISEAPLPLSAESLPQLRFEIIEAATILRMSRATLYERIRDGQIAAQKDGRRKYITASELHRYVYDPDHQPG